jgi:hypothetical protein
MVTCGWGPGAVSMRLSAHGTLEISPQSQQAGQDHGG